MGSGSKEKQSKTGSKAASKTKTVAGKAKTTDKSGQKVQPKKAKTQTLASKKAFPPSQKKMQQAGLEPQVSIETLQSQQIQPETSEAKTGEIPELYEFSKVKQKTMYPDFTKTLNFLDYEEVETLKIKSTAWVKQTTQIALNDLTYGNSGGNYCYRHTKSVKGIVDIHPKRVKRVKVPKTKEELYLVIIDPILKSGAMISSSYRIGAPPTTRREEPRYPAFLPRMDEMSFGEASHLQTKPIVGPFAVQMEIYFVPESYLMPTTAHPTKVEPYMFYRYSGSRKKGFVTIHSDRVKKVSEALVDYYLVLAEKPDGLAVETQKIRPPFVAVELELPKVDKKTAHNLLYGESLEGLQDPSNTEYHDLVFIPKQLISKDNWERKPGYFYYQRQNKQKTVIHAERITQKEDHYEVLTDVDPEAKEIPLLMEKQKPKREHRSWLTLDNLFNKLDNETLVGEPTPDSHEYEIDPDQVQFAISTMGIG